MKLRFNLDYQATFGEELALNIITDDKGDATERHRMFTHDGRNWTCEMVKELPMESSVRYFYSVERNGTPSRSEWTVAPHQLTMTAVLATLYIIYDKWIDIPEDAYLYSSALTDCIFGRTCHSPKVSGASATVTMKVRAPQLRRGERLALIGSDDYIGGWAALKAVEMAEQQPNEWVVTLDAAKFASPAFEYKFVILDEDKDVTPLWEDRMNRTFTLSSIQQGENVVIDNGEALFPIYPWRGAGTVIPVFSLRSEGSFGVGDFGDLMMMIDWVSKTSQRALQILPINDTTITNTWTDSYPYNSISIYALHPQYTDLRQLPELKDDERKAYYEKLRKELNGLPQIDYERVNATKMFYLHELFLQEGAAMMRQKDFKCFFDSNKQWLVPYAAFCNYRDQYGTATFSQWPDHQRLSEEECKEFGNARTKKYKEVSYWYFVQYILDKQLRRVHDYAREKRVILKGDIPIGISRDSVEAWTEPNYFNMDGQAGAPPDAFSVNGQNWGFPTYNWDEMMKDGCSWWLRRFRKMAEYFDAFRIDHVLGFFRIWEIPTNAVHGLLGQFSPSLGMTREEICAYGLNFQEERFTRPFITDWVLDRIFREHAQEVKGVYLESDHDDLYKMKPEYDTQRKVEAAFKGKDGEKDVWIRDGLYALISDVLFLRDRKNPNLFHPRVGVQLDFIYESLYDCDKEAFNHLYNDYFYRRNNHFWYGEAMKKLQRLTQATRMLVCAEDLGMVPDCVPWVMNELRILSLEIQSMPKDSTVRFGHLSRNPYRSVCTFSTHDMPTLRQWWDENEGRTQNYYATMLHRGGGAPHPLPGWLAKEILSRHLMCPSMLCLLSLQDWLSIDEALRLPDENAERINIPATPRHYWRYRMHTTIEQLMDADDFNNTIKTMIKESGRK